MAKSSARAAAPKPRAQRRPADAGGTRSTAELEQEIAALKAKLGARGPDPDAEVAQYPKVKYRKHPIDARHANGYEVRRVGSPEEEATLATGWVDSPDEVL